MSVKQTESKITALYERLSRDDDNAGDMCSSNSMRGIDPVRGRNDTEGRGTG